MPSLFLLYENAVGYFLFEVSEYDEVGTSLKHI